MEKILHLHIESNVFIEFVKNLTNLIFKVALTIFVVNNILTTNTQINQNRILPIKLESTETKDFKRTKEALIILNLPKEKVQQFTNSVIMGAKVAQVDPVLIVALMYTESSFKNNAKSSMGYQGLMQTPSKTGFTEVDIMHGSVILKEKLSISKGDIQQALTYYKGSKFKKNTVGYKQANQVIALYNNLNHQIQQG